MNQQRFQSLQLGVRLKEHQKDSEKIAEKKFARAMRKSSTTEQHKSAITDHVAQEDHLIDWEETKIIDRDSNPFTKKSEGGYSNS